MCYLLVSMQSKELSYNNDRVDECFIAMLEVWLTRVPTPGWSDMVEALKGPGVERTDLAKNIIDNRDYASDS